MRHVYDSIGDGYSRVRRPDPRWAAQLADALGAARTVLDVGAGTGSYEPADRAVVAVEPALTMLAQRPATAAPAVRGVAAALPFPDRCFDVAMAVLTVHHWPDAAAGLDELQRVSRRQVVLTWDREVGSRYWLVAEYLPEIVRHEAAIATLPEVVTGLRGARRAIEVEVLPTYADLTDGVLAAYWRRPEAYLDPAVRAGISGLRLLDPAVVDRALDRLRRDLADGTWARRHADLLDLDHIDAGYRLVVAGPADAGVADEP